MTEDDTSFLSSFTRRVFEGRTGQLVLQEKCCHFYTPSVLGDELMKVLNDQGVSQTGKEPTDKGKVGSYLRGSSTPVAAFPLRCSQPARFHPALLSKLSLVCGKPGNPTRV